MNYQAFIVITSIVISWFAGLIAEPAKAQSFNVDFGSNSVLGFSTLPDTFGAEAGQTGRWNDITTTASTSLVDLSGNSTAVTLNIIGMGLSISNTAGPTTNNETLTNDHLLNIFGNWSVAITGLADATYTVYAYAPTATGLPTGDFTVNGMPVSSLPGSNNALLVQGTDFEIVPEVTVSGGALTISSSVAPTGLSGLQLQQTAVVPEPSQVFGTLLALGLGGLFWWRRQRLTFQAQDGSHYT